MCPQRSLHNDKTRFTRNVEEYESETHTYIRSHHMLEVCPGGIYIPVLDEVCVCVCVLCQHTHEYKHTHTCKDRERERERGNLPIQMHARYRTASAGGSQSG